MSNHDDERTRLQLSERPAKLLKRIRAAVREHIKPHTENRKGAELGGGSVLNARWNHRLSRDLDIHLRLTTSEDSRELLDRTAKAAGGHRIEHPKFPQIQFSRERDDHVDICCEAPQPRTGEREATVDGEASWVLSNAQIMTGKLLGRGMSSPGRDLYDVAVCALADPDALQVAVNGLDDDKVNSILKIYKENETLYAKEVHDLDGVPEQLEPIRANPAAYATTRSWTRSTNAYRYAPPTAPPRSKRPRRTKRRPARTPTPKRCSAAWNATGSTCSCRRSTATTARCSATRSTACGAERRRT